MRLTRTLVLLPIVLACALAVACQDAAFDRAQLLGGEVISADTLEQGRHVYGRYCMRCHGANGDGKGLAARGQWPPPRDFRKAQFKFAGIEDRSLPSDQALRRIVLGGLRGTAMQPWLLSDRELYSVIQYIKSLSLPGKGFRSERLSVSRPKPSVDPFQDPEQRSEAIAMGERLYHASFQCSSCHPAYLDAAQVATLGVAMRPDAPFDSVPKWSENYQSVLLPPDFLRHDMRSVAVRAQAHDVEDIYRSIAFGLQGPMPGFVHLGEQENWAVAHYVKSLADQRGTRSARQLRERLLRSLPSD